MSDIEQEGIDFSQAIIFEVLNIKHVEIRTICRGYISPGNTPESTVSIEISGTVSKGTVTRFVLLFYLKGDTRIAKPFYNNDRTTLTVMNPLETLPAWISSLSNIARSEGLIISYHEFSNSYHVEILRSITHKR